MKKNAWELVREDWREFDMGFACICGKFGLYIDQDDPEVCPDCGRIYTLTVLFEVEEKDK